MSRMEAQLEGREVRIDVPRDLSVHVDPVLLEQVLWNLLENAVKHTPAATPIALVASQREGTVSVEVADRGPGIPDEVAPRIFEKFVRAGGPGGVGLGLAICRGIVQAHGGTIGYARREGGGASFRVCLPTEGAPPEIPDDDLLEAASRD